MDENKKLIGDEGKTELLREIANELINDPDWELPPESRFALFGNFEWQFLYL